MVQCVADGTRHTAVSSQCGNLTIGGNLTPGDFLYCFIDACCGRVDSQVVALRNHAADFFIGNGTVQNNGIPMLLVLMPAGHDGGVGASPEIPPFRGNLYIQIDKTVSFICPEKYLPAAFCPHQLPVGVMKGGILVGARKGQPIA